MPKAPSCQEGDLLSGIRIGLSFLYVPRRNSTLFFKSEFVFLSFSNLSSIEFGQREHLRAPPPPHSFLSLFLEPPSVGPSATPHAPKGHYP